MLFYMKMADSDDRNCTG